MPKKKKPLHVRVKELTHTNTVYVAFISQAIDEYAQKVEALHEQAMEDEAKGMHHLVHPELWLNVAKDCNKVINDK